MKIILLVLLFTINILYADFKKDKWYECIDSKSKKHIGINKDMYGGLTLVNRNTIIDDIYYASEIAKGSKIYKFKTSLGEYIVEETKKGAKITDLYKKNSNYVHFETYIECKVQDK